jgi:hypothetical protein
VDVGVGVGVGVGVADVLDSDGAAVDAASWQPTSSAPAARQQSSKTSLLMVDPRTARTQAKQTW